MRNCRCASLHRNQLNRISHDFERFCLIFLLANPTAVALSVFKGVGGCGWSNASKIILISAANCPFLNNPPHSASAADAMF